MVMAAGAQQLVCELHPELLFLTGFCPLCLRQRLHSLEPSGAGAGAGADDDRRSSTSSAAIRPPPDLRRCRSFSASLPCRPVEIHPASASTAVRPMKPPRPPPPPHPPANEIPATATAASGGGSGFWYTASLLSKKLQKWRRKERPKKETGNDSHAITDVPPCDIGARFSLDASRFSVNDRQLLWEEPRASWDGYLRSRPQPRLDTQIPVQEDTLIPGGSALMRDYYMDSSSHRRRRSLDRSHSYCQVSFDSNNADAIANLNRSPPGSSELFHIGSRHKIDIDSRDSSSSFMNFSEKFGEPPRKSKRWGKMLNMFGFIHRSGDQKGTSRGGAKKSCSESLPELRNNPVNRKVVGNNNNVSARHSFCGASGLGNMRADAETNGHRSNSSNRGGNEFAFERNQSSRFSPKHADNGMLRFYLTPMRNSRRNAGSGKSNSYHSSESFTKTTFRMY